MSLFKRITQQSFSISALDKKGTSIFPVQSSTKLLSSVKRQSHLSTIKSLLHLQPKIYDNVCYTVIQACTEFMQSLPESQRGLFAQDGGFLDHALERTARALTLCLAYFLPEEKTFHSVSLQQWKWVYAVFTAALCLDLGKIAVKYQVKLCQKQGQVIDEWIPYTGTMLGKSGFYKFEYRKENRDNLCRRVTPLLARQVLDTASSFSNNKISEMKGFNLIASDTNVLEAWLSILGAENHRITEPLMSIIPQADIETIEEHIKTLKTANTTSSIFVGLTKGQETLNNLTAGEACLHWLRQQLTEEKMTVNQQDSYIHLTQEGILIDTAIFNDFANTNPVHKNSELIEKQFRGLAELYGASIGELGERYSRIQGISTNERSLKSTEGISRIERFKRGLVLDIPFNLLFTKSIKQIPTLSTHVMLSPQNHLVKNVTLSTTKPADNQLNIS